jgi:hypothetical protein
LSRAAGSTPSGGGETEEFESAMPGILFAAGGSLSGSGLTRLTAALKTE